MALLAACGSDAPATSPELGHASFALELPNGAELEWVDYDVTLTFLEEKPPEVYLNEQYHVVRDGGELTAVVPCHTKPSGEGLNQVDIVARIKVPALEEPLVARSSAVFTCKRNQDVLVNITLSVIGALPSGFLDIDAIPIGTLCSASMLNQRDTVYGVCAAAACGSAGTPTDYFKLSTECDAVQAANPTFWMCGDPTDWQINGRVANSFFPVPERNGSWTFGIVALDGYRMAQVDPTLTDPEGNLTVWTGASAVRATVNRTAGVVTPNLPTQLVYDFVAELELAPLQVGLPSVHVLLLVKRSGTGMRTAYQTKFGPCDVPTDVVDFYPGSPVIDVRRDGLGAVKLVLADPGTGLATLVARCETAWDQSGPAPKPVITCGEPSPLLPP